jgi:hypothetical protein
MPCFRSFSSLFNCKLAIRGGIEDLLLLSKAIFCIFKPKLQKK